MDEHIEIRLPADDEGFVSCECPHCAERFKLQAAEFEEHETLLLYCPLCGLNEEPGAFLTREVRDAAVAHAENMALQAVHEMFKRLEQQSSGNKSLKWKAGPKPPVQPVPELREVTDLAVVQLACCGASAKVPDSDALSGVYCPYCGSE
jgi:hypothetical protein